MVTIILHTFKDRLGTLAAYCAGSLVFVWLYVALFPFVQKQGAALAKLMDAYPKGIMQAFGITDLAATFTHLGNFLSTELFSFVFPIMLVALVVGYAAGALAGEVERGTIELLLAQPISRLQLYAARYLAGINMLGAFTIVTIFGILPLAAAYHVDVSTADVARFWVVAFLFGLALLSLGFLASSIFSDKGKPTFIVTGLVIFMYVLNIVASLKPSLEKLKYLSFFHYYNPAQTLGSGALIDSHTAWVLLGVSVIATGLGAIIFTHRDLATT